MQNVTDFVVSTSNSEEFLSVNVSLILRICGALRVSEIVAVNFEGVEFKVDCVKNNIPKSETDQAGPGHHFLISPSVERKKCFCEIIKRYHEKFDEKDQTGRF